MSFSGNRIFWKLKMWLDEVWQKQKYVDTALAFVINFTQIFA